MNRFWIQAVMRILMVLQSENKDSFLKDAECKTLYKCGLFKAQSPEKLHNNTNLLNDTYILSEIDAPSDIEGEEVSSPDIEQTEKDETSDFEGEAEIHEEEHEEINIISYIPDGSSDSTNIEGEEITSDSLSGCDCHESVESPKPKNTRKQGTINIIITFIIISNIVHRNAFV